MRRGFGFLWVVLTGILLAIVGVVSYDAGWSAGAATVPANAAAEAAVPYYAYGPHLIGFGFFGFFWLLFFLFILFLLFRIARFGLGWGHRGWGYGGGWKRGYGGGVPPSIEQRMQDWHQRAHGEAAPTPTPPPPPPPPDQRQA